MLVLADDLTGACDVGAEFGAAGWPAVVPVRGAGPPRSLRIFNTQSRNLNRARAVRRVRRLLPGPPIDFVFKKIDTALRGHVGAELEAVLGELPGSIALVAPSIPEAARYTRSGCQWSGDLPVHRTFARDAASAVRESSIARVLARETDLEAQLFGLEAVRSGRLSAHLERALSCGRRIMVLDSESDDDLAAISESARQIEFPIVMVGSTGLARAFVGRLEKSRRGAGRHWPASGAAVVVAGSANGVTRGQVAAALSLGAARHFTVSPGDGDCSVAGEAAAELALGGNVILAPPPLDQKPAQAQRRGVRKALARVALALAETGRVARLLLVGGETAHAVLHLARADSLGVCGAWAPLVANAIVCGGRLGGLPLLTKGGSTGDESLLCRALTGEGGGRPAPVAEEVNKRGEGACASRS